MRTQDRLLTYLKSERSDFISGEELSRLLGVSRSAIWKEVSALRKIGYKIKAMPHEGYRLVSIPDRLFADEIRWGLKTEWMGKQIFSYEELDSTNDVAWRLGEEGLPEGTCVFAEHQKKGRGRLGRSWTSPRHRSILLSALLRPDLPPDGVARITLAAALSVVRAVRLVAGVSAGIKWPNDVLYREKKICGILTEMNAEMDRVRFVVLGIGINVNTTVKDLPPGSTSLREITGKEISRVALTQTLLVELEKDLKRLRNGEFERLTEEWEEHSETTGKRVVATLINRSVQGQATGIDADGALWIRKDSGLQERILSGDIKHCRMSSPRRRGSSLIPAKTCLPAGRDRGLK